MSRPRGRAVRYREFNPEKAKQVRDMYFKERKKQHEIAEIFGIKQNSVSRIVSGLVWEQA